MKCNVLVHIEFYVHILCSFYCHWVYIGQSLLHHLQSSHILLPIAPILSSNVLFKSFSHSLNPWGLPLKSKLSHSVMCLNHHSLFLSSNSLSGFSPTSIIYYSISPFYCFVKISFPWPILKYFHSSTPHSP